MPSTYQSITVNAPVERVWSSIRDFHNLSWAPNVVESCEPIGDRTGDQIGAQRLLHNVFHETLRELSDLNHTIRYSIDDGPAPVSRSDVQGFVGHVRLFSITEGDGGTFVEWSSSWDGTEGACDFCHNVYVALLNDLKATVEG